MKNVRLGKWLVWLVCGLLTIAAFFAKDFVLYDFNMNVPDYSYSRMEGEKPQSADTSVWFAYGSSGRMLQYGLDAETKADSLTVYALTQTGEVSVTKGSENPIQQNSLGHFIAALPAKNQDMDGDGALEVVYDYARADFGQNAFNPAPQRFLIEEIPFELVFAERKYIMAYYENEILTNAEIFVTSHNGEQKSYMTDEHGWIKGLSNRKIREGFTASYSPNRNVVYRMHYALENYSYFSPHFFAAHIPLLVILALTVIGIAAVYLIRNRLHKDDPAYAIYARERMGIYPRTLQQKTDSKFLLIRWICLLAGMFLWTYAVMFFVTTLLCFILLGGILCGFLCPAGLLQDLMDKLRQALLIRPIVVTDRMNRLLQPIKWVWIVLFLGFAFTGGDFCDICPLKGFTTAQGGYWTNLYLGGFFAVIILVGSFFIKRFWCIICPMGMP